MARLFTCADVLEDSNGDVSSGDDSAYGYLPKATSFMPDADELSGTEDMHDMASTMDQDQDSERPGEGSLCDSGK